MIIIILLLPLVIVSLYSKVPNKEKKTPFFIGGVFQRLDIKEEKVWL